MTNLDKNIQIDPQLQIGLTTFFVKDLVGMARYYQAVIGLAELNQDYGSVILGIPADPSTGEAERPILRLVNQPDGKAYPRLTGLFHLAILLPRKSDLGQWLRHYSQNHQLDGAGDHLVSEALYLSDPEGNGLEIYWDRPRSEWTTGENGKIKMDTLRVDIPALLAAAPDEPFEKMPFGTTTGHIHLQVDDVNKAVDFYHRGLGFDMTEFFSSQAGFFGAGGYHHHIGANIWNSRGASAPPAGSLGLSSFELIFSTDEKLEETLTRLEENNIVFDRIGTYVEVFDPAGNRLILKS